MITWGVESKKLTSSILNYCGDKMQIKE